MSLQNLAENYSIGPQKRAGIVRSAAAIVNSNVAVNTKKQTCG